MRRMTGWNFGGFVLSVLLCVGGTPFGSTEDWIPDPLHDVETGSVSDNVRASCEGFDQGPPARELAERRAREDALRDCQGTAVERIGDWNYTFECRHNGIYVKWSLSAPFRCSERQERTGLSGPAAEELLAIVGHDVSVDVMCGDDLEEVRRGGRLLYYKNIWKCSLVGDGMSRDIVDVKDHDQWERKEGASDLYRLLPVYRQSRTGRFLSRKLATVLCHDAVDGADCEIQGRIKP